MRSMDIREARDQAALFGMDVFEGVTATGYALGAFMTAYCTYEGVSDLFQVDSQWESSPFTALPGALILAGAMRALTNLTQTGREVLVEHRSRSQQ